MLTSDWFGFGFVVGVWCLLYCLILVGLGVVCCLGWCFDFIVWIVLRIGCLLYSCVGLWLLYAFVLWLFVLDLDLLVLVGSFVGVVLFWVLGCLFVCLLSYVFVAVITRVGWVGFGGVVVWLFALLLV